MRFLLLLSLVFILGPGCPGQKTLVLEKVGTHRIIYFHEGDWLKVRTQDPDHIWKGDIWNIRDSSACIADAFNSEIRLRDFKVVYRQFPAMKAASYTLFIAGATFFSILTINHLINNEQVFDKYSWIIPGSIILAGGITLAMSQRSDRIGLRWKVKVLEFPYRVY